MTIDEAAELLGLAPQTLRHQARKKKLKARKMGRGWYVSEAEVKRYAEEHKKGQGT